MGRPIELFGRGLAPSVVDADALLSSIHNQCTTNWQSRLSQIGEAQRSPVFASAHVLGEVRSGFARVVGRGAVTVEEMSRCFESDYLPHIRWVTVSDGHSPDERVSAVAQIDVTDAPTAHLASLIAPVMVYSNDHSLRNTGFAPGRWRDAALAAVMAGENQAMEEGAVILLTLPTHALFKGSARLSRGIGLPGWVGPLAIVGAIAWALSDRERREVTARFVDPFADAAVRFSEHRAATEAAVAAALFMPGKARTLKQRIAGVLARVREPALSREIAGQLLDDDAVVTVGEIRAILTDEPEFVPVGHRWQLGQRLPTAIGEPSGRSGTVPRQIS